MVGQAEQKEGRWFDRVAAGLGIACAVHCLSMPLLIGTLPFLSLSWLASETTEIWMVAVLIVTALVGIIWGIKRHGNLRVISTFIAAVILLAVGQVLHEAEYLTHLLTILGSIAIACAHLFSARVRKTSPGPEQDNCCDHS